MNPLPAAVVSPATYQQEGAESESLTITIPGGRIEEGGPSTETAAGSEGLNETFDGLAPETGIESIDQAISTLTQAVGNLARGFIEHLPQIVIGILLLIATTFAAKVLQRIVKRVATRLRVRTSLRDLAGQLTHVGVWFLGLLIATSIVFPSFGVAEIVATAGLMSIALGFAFQDIFENFFAGVLILWRFPFDIDDFVEIESEGIVGKVEDIWIRMTLIRLTTGELVTVPNATVYKSPIRILTNRDHRRVTVDCGVAYGEDVGEAREVIQEAVASCESVRDEAPIEIFLKAFGSSSMDFEVTWWTGATPVEQRQSRDEVIEAVKRALDQAGIEIPYPYRVLTFTQNEPLIYERLGAFGSSKGEASAD